MSLNRMVLKSLEDSVNIHREAIKRYLAASKDLSHPQGEDQNGEEAIRRILAFHKANLEVCNSMFTEISADTPLTGMLSILRQEHEKLLEKIPVKMPLEYPQGYFALNRNDPFLSKIRRTTEWTLLAPRQALSSLLNPIRKLMGKKIPEPVLPVHQVHARHLYRQFLLPHYLNRLTELIQETRKEISASLTVLLENELKEHPKFHWK